MLADFTPSGIAQPGLFDEIQPRKNSEKLMKTLDELNQSGKGKVWFAGRGTAPEWQMKREMLSQCYTMKDKTDTHLQFWVTNKKQCSPDIPPLAQFNPASKIDLFIVLIFVVRSG